MPDSQHILQKRVHLLVPHPTTVSTWGRNLLFLLFAPWSSYGGLSLLLLVNRPSVCVPELLNQWKFQLRYLQHHSRILLRFRNTLNSVPFGLLNSIMCSKPRPSCSEAKGISLYIADLRSSIAQSYAIWFASPSFTTSKAWVYRFECLNVMELTEIWFSCACANCYGSISLASFVHLLRICFDGILSIPRKSKTCNMII